MSKHTRNSAALDDLLQAIVRDDIATAKKFLNANPSLAIAQKNDTDTLFQAGIFHWLYKNDTALHLAAAGYRTQIVGLLLDCGADPNAAHNRRQSGPLHYAADGYLTGPAWNEKQQRETIRRLLDAGAQINAQDANGATPLHRAVRTRCAGAVQLLLHSGAKPQLKNKSGSTPFHLAVQNTGRGGSGADAAKAAQREIIREFVDRRISVRLQDGKGDSVLDCARSQWIKELLSA